MHRPTKKTFAPCKQNANPEDPRRAHRFAITERVTRTASSPESTETGTRIRGMDKMQEPKCRTQGALPQGQSPPRAAELREGGRLDSGRGATRSSAPTPMAASPYRAQAVCSGQRPAGDRAQGAAGCQHRGAKFGHVPPPKPVSQSTVGRTWRRTKAAAS